METITYKPLLEECSFQFTQEPNCLSTEEFETIEIKCVSSLGIDRDENNEFFILKTEGWALDGVEELEELFERIRKVLIKE